MQTTPRWDKGPGGAEIVAKISEGMGETASVDVEGLQADVASAEAAGSLVFPRTIELDWCVYNMRESKVEVDQTLYILPAFGGQMGLHDLESSADMLKRTGLNWERIEKEGVTLE
jgi:hypothetical protein